MVGQVAKVLANLVVLGSGIVLKAFSQAYRQALINAAKSGVAQETVQNMVQKPGKTMSLHEARLILGVSENASWDDIMKKYETLFERNATMGSFYIQSKVQRAKECLEAAQQATGEQGSSPP
ncbi:hypothetical protein O6H91_22G031300 [Diphasiastrum complanatum]|uniref:Uncharacterized protein n=1 Tax=Diphasiastrum complanatum TaxID=34168 RepID=A0ACC2AEE6_DIPCM|nr:hypothetical protein O6H91_22G031300 [Diphasiastrum complanatum]